MDLANQSGASSIEGAVQKLNGLLSEPSKPTESKDNPAPEAKQEPINESNAQETPVEQSDTDKPSRRRKAKLGEREIEFEVLTDDVDLDLIPKGLMMENDYRQKTMSLADERKAFEANKSDYDKALAELNDIVMMNAKKLDSDEMKELKELNPDQYWKEFEEVKTQADKLKSFKERRDKELLAEQQKAMDAELNKYSQVIPEWLDEDVKTKDVEKMVSMLANVGFSQEEIGGIYDSRIMAIVRKAALFDEMTSKKLDSKRVKSVPKSSKPSANTGSVERTAKQKAMDQLKKTGKVQDAQSVIRQYLGG